ncbi:MAG: hypothetical protein SV775_05080 [Thermodesulfobacteriota bacterium]|nr:hypothetical protein [Thermodesulfobacteriota bacterium]
MKEKRKTGFLLTAFVLAFLITLVLSESMLRIAGYSPWKKLKIFPANTPIMHQYDHKLGWKNKPGKYKVPPFSENGKEACVTLLQGGNRDCGYEGESGKADQVVIVGGSYTVGWGLSDDETFAWLLQRRIPSIEVLNYGTAGYGTYQSLLTLEAVLKKISRPRVVLYGFMLHHKDRNVASFDWLELLRKISRAGIIDVPYCTLEKGLLTKHEPEGFISLPLSDRLALVAFVEKTWMRHKTRRRVECKNEVTKRLLIEMNQVAKNYGARFLVSIFQSEKSCKKELMEFMGQNDIIYIDNDFEMTEEFVIQGDGHPNARMNAKWIDGIEVSARRYLKDD